MKGASLEANKLSSTTVELLNNQEIRNLVSAYFWEKEIAISFDSQQMLQRDRFGSDEEYFEYEDRFFGWQDTNEVMGELAHGATNEVELKWNEFLGIEWTNNLFMWFASYRDPDMMYGCAWDSAEDQSDDIKTCVRVVEAFAEVNPELFQLCRQVSRERVMAARNSEVIRHSSVDRFVLKWRCDRIMTEAYGHIQSLAEKEGIDSWELCR